jgi:hypothetical protein
MEILRLESVNNRAGKPEVFCSVIFDTDAYGKLHFGHWLTPKEYAMYTADNSTIETIMEGYRRTVELQKAQELAQPQ